MRASTGRWPGEYPVPNKDGKSTMISFYWRDVPQDAILAKVDLM